MTTKIVSNYSAIILKEMFKKAKSSLMKHEKVRQRENALSLGDVGTSRYWKTKSDMEYYFSETIGIYREMFELDCVVNWSDKLHQDRYSFVLKDDDVLKRYKEFVFNNRLKKESAQG